VRVPDDGVAAHSEAQIGRIQEKAARTAQVRFFISPPPWIGLPEETRDLEEGLGPESSGSDVTLEAGGHYVAIVTGSMW